MKQIGSEKSAPRCPFGRGWGVYSYLGKAHGNNTFQKGASLSLSPNPSPLAFAGNWAEQRPVFRGCAGAR